MPVKQEDYPETDKYVSISQLAHNWLFEMVLKLIFKSKLYEH